MANDKIIANLWIYSRGFQQTQFKYVMSFWILGVQNLRVYGRADTLKVFSVIIKQLTNDQISLWRDVRCCFTKALR